MKRIPSVWKEIQTIPNLLSILRMILLPLYLYFVVHEAFYSAGVIILFSGVTDFLDGFIARKFHQITELGKVLDPLADKLTQLVLIVSLAWERPFIWWILGLFLVKEGFMLIAGIIGLHRKVKLDGAKWYGKLATAVIYVGMVILLLFPEISEVWLKWILIVITYSLLQSFILYILEYKNLLTKQEKPEF
ncbi:CDP-diacylglycerol-glycerol-3-phosphate 3-phosphatidyltransferase [Enterococcus sp. 10A9_DIV0425]|uniref:CDP-diacylglycerol--glycerol-3-phosphate 3-phosphatidyltransferase n=1 Tax=Candidatus Enterococcus wittei TaxID=1987383 RepID=A0A242K0P5_9ENTE|nr:CDP-alcohol phosphatidyltransferase family protein [Enterococcus sp. 10A9_DIV0425]OTP11228.1 CDP-diacylglycerol-glycerol-3-phosphate 3-phosphatidyltransferase [Enterococcus sp. 10A9_DIV0425]THE15780.1 CDP-alcohol phosphatidyltransferase family protein [Enterococcus hirae]